MLDPASSGVWLGIDTKCPGTEDSDLMDKLVASATEIYETAMSSDFIRLLEQTPRIIGPYQPDVLPLFRLEELASELLSANRLIPWRSPDYVFLRSRFTQREMTTSSPVVTTRPLTLEDRTLMEGHLQPAESRLAGQTFAIQFMARDLLRPVWCVVDGFFCLWAFDNGTVYMPLPPRGSGDLRNAIFRCFAFMDSYNPAPGISRIENASLPDLHKDVLAEFKIRPGYPEYLYRTRDLVALRGRSMRKRRSEYRAFERNRGVEYRPYRASDEPACLTLFEKWQTHRMNRTADSVARKLLTDSRSFHLRALRDGEAMGLVGGVACLEGQVVGYTFGFPLNEETFVVALEATDPAYRGASVYIFCEFCKEQEAFTYINVMDDSGLPGLRCLKRSFHPFRMEPAFVLYRA
jgi:hypothetical protein